MNITSIFQQKYYSIKYLSLLFLEGFFVQFLILFSFVWFLRLAGFVGAVELIHFIVVKSAVVAELPVCYWYLC